MTGKSKKGRAADPSTTDAASTDVEVMNAEDLGRFLRLTTSKRKGAAAQAVNMRIKRGQSMPPSIHLPGTRRRIWWRPSVRKWLAQHERSL